MTYPKTSQKHWLGQFRYRDLTGGRIEIDPEWVRQNMVAHTFAKTGNGALSGRTVTVHRRTLKVWLNVETLLYTQQAGASVRTYGGVWVPRHMMWKRSKPLSNHSWGSAIDLNVEWNAYGQQQASATQHKLWALVFSLAGRGLPGGLRFAWGALWDSKDPMHFEIVER